MSLSGVLVLAGCCSDSAKDPKNRSDQPWNKPMKGTGQLPGSLNEQR